jgi:hypothetical protein
MKTKTILTHYYTKRCTYGNVYHAVRIENASNGKSFTVYTPSLGNVEGILQDAFGGWEAAGIRSFSSCTGSARYGSLPVETAPGLNPCSFEDGKPYKGSWKTELNKIGFRLPKKSKAA